MTKPNHVDHLPINISFKYHIHSTKDEKYNSCTVRLRIHQRIKPSDLCVCMEQHHHFQRLRTIMHDITHLLSCQSNVFAMLLSIETKHYLFEENMKERESGRQERERVNSFTIAKTQGEMQ
eukprot:282405_1